MPDSDLESFVETVCGDSHLRVETDLGDGFVRLRSSEAQRRQAAQDIRCSEDIVIEMLRNSRDAHAHNIFLATSKCGNTRRIVMLDDGDGVPGHLQQAIFEPRVTSKLDTFHMDKWGVHGRGMALYSITENAESAYVIASGPQLGSSFVVETDTRKLPEKTDQSSFPTFTLGEGGTVNVRGPKNILRTTCEFAIEARQSCSVFIGSATDVAATLYQYAQSSASALEKAVAGNPVTLAVCKRLATSRTPAAFAEISAGLGLEMSERSARRIMDGQIKPLAPLLSLISIDGMKDPESASESHTGKVASRPAADARGLQISSDSLNEFERAVRKAFGPLAQAHFLDESVDPTVSVSKDRIRIEIPVVKLR